MARTGVIDLATAIGGVIQKNNVESALNRYEKHYDRHEGDEQIRSENCVEMTNAYYNLVTSFYEYGWGDAFHFAPRWKGESLKESLTRYEHFIALQLGLKRGMKVLDLGCGIGGPVRQISRFSQTFVTGVNNNEYQITRAIELTRIAGLEKSCNFVKADFMKMPFPDNAYDAAYAMEAVCHAPDIYGCCKEIYRVLKPGSYFANYEWCMTDSYNPNNESHRKIKAGIELGSGVTNISTTHQWLDALKKAKFEVIWEKDLSLDSPVPWYLPLDAPDFSLRSFRLTTAGRFLTRIMVKTLEFVRLAPAGSSRVLTILENFAKSMVDGGRTGIFTPHYFFLVQKPLFES